MARIHHLYRCFDAEGQLLYVGVSWNVAARMGQHKRGAPWWKHIATIRLEVHPSRRAVEKAERDAIRRERPLFNKAHSEHGPVAEEPDSSLADWQIVGAAKNANGRWDVELLPPGGEPDLAMHNIEARSLLEAVEAAIDGLKDFASSQSSADVIPLASRRKPK